MYWPASWFLADAARKEYRHSPDGLFVTSCFYNFLALSILGLLFFMGLFDRSNSLDVLPKLLVWLGWVGWITWKRAVREPDPAIR